MFPIRNSDKLTKLNTLQRFGVPMTRFINWDKKNQYRHIDQRRLENSCKKFKKQVAIASNTVEQAVFAFIDDKGPATYLNDINYWKIRDHYM